MSWAFKYLVPSWWVPSLGRLWRGGALLEEERHWGRLWEFQASLHFICSLLPVCSWTCDPLVSFSCHKACQWLPSSPRWILSPPELWTKTNTSFLNILWVMAFYYSNKNVMNTPVLLLTPEEARKCHNCPYGVTQMRRRTLHSVVSKEPSRIRNMSVCLEVP